ncbi:MAG: L,D-transpeptidase [Jatrophihabitans sp.]
MRHLLPLAVSAALLLGALAVAEPAAAASPSSLSAGNALHVGEKLVSSNGAYTARLEAGQLVVRTTSGRMVWGTPKRTSAQTLYLGRTGQLSLTAGRSAYWAAGTSGSGSADVLTLRSDGVLVLGAAGLTVWTSQALNRCPRTSGQTFDVGIGGQVARMCNGGQQIRVTPITSGASAYGDGTPLGTWNVYAKQRNTTLYPSSGGAYPVKYWVPYNGAYGVHDSSWQHFPYGSSLYTTRGSHGCTHVPAQAMSWFFQWVRIGTTVTIHG